MFQEETMTQPRKNIVSIENTPYYHCIGRCVRRAFLCGKDEFSGKDYEHRRQWVVDRLNLLSEVFSIDVCAYAVMSNHYHLVIRLSPEESRDWNQFEVIDRWQRLYSGGALIQMYQSGNPLSDAQKMMLDTQTEVWRERLTDLSWFMRCLNEHLARLANREDKCTGHFWEGRFKSQALLDDAALMTCMAYVDLNPIRASIAKTPETSNYTSVKERIREHMGKSHQAANLLMMDGDNQHSQGLPFYLNDYLELLDWTGRAIREGETGSIPMHLQPIIQRLNIASNIWMKQVTHFGKRFRKITGTSEITQSFVLKIGKEWLNDQGSNSPIEEPP